jgi:hypothetical protein
MDRRAPIALVLVSAMLLIWPSAPSARAHSGDHHIGVYTTSRYDGASAWIEVTNPTVRANTDDFVANRILAKKRTNGPGQAWIEVGWAEIGWAGLVGGVPEQFAYVYDSAHPVWHLYDTLCVSAGCHIDVRIVSDPGCDFGALSCVWSAQLFNHTTGTWQNLHSVRLPMDRAYLEEYTEIHTDPNHPLTGHLEVDQALNEVDWQTQRRYADGSFRAWSGTASDTSADAPYCAHWINNRYRFEAQTGGC